MPAPKIDLSDVTWPEDVTRPIVVVRRSDNFHETYEVEGQFVYRKPARVPRRPRCEPFVVIAYVPASAALAIQLASSEVIKAFRQGIAENIRRITEADADAMVVKGAPKLPVVPAQEAT